MARHTEPKATEEKMTEQTEHEFPTEGEAWSFIEGVEYANDSSLIVYNPVRRESDGAWIVVTEEVES